MPRNTLYLINNVLKYFIWGLHLEKLLRYHKPWFRKKEGKEGSREKEMNSLIGKLVEEYSKLMYYFTNFLLAYVLK